MRILTVFLSVFFLTACQTTSVRNQTSGALLGGVLGGMLGAQAKSYQTAAVIGGTLIGASVGSNIGARMDSVDKMMTKKALEVNRTGQSTEWKNPDTNNQYRVTPTRTFSSSTSVCREYATEVFIRGRQEMLYGKACREPDGTWQVQ